jgi:hypothetical protein
MRFLADESCDFAEQEGDTLRESFVVVKPARIRIIRTGRQ